MNKRSTKARGKGGPFPSVCFGATSRREIALFVEDFAHKEIIGALVQRLAQDARIAVRLDWRNARHGHGKVVQEVKDYLRDLTGQGDYSPDLLIVATDANCKGLNERANEFKVSDTPAPAATPIILAIPDPHIERWLLLDGAAFKAVFGKGCDAPDLKCCRDRYKERLIKEIFAAGVTPSLGGIEFAQDLVNQMDIDRAANADKSSIALLMDCALYFEVGNHEHPEPLHPPRRAPAGYAIYGAEYRLGASHPIADKPDERPSLPLVG